MEMHAFSECLPFVGEQTNKRHKSAFKVRPTKTKKIFSRKGWSKKTACIVSTITWNNLKIFLFSLFQSATIYRMWIREFLAIYCLFSPLFFSLSLSSFCSLRLGKWVVLMHYSKCNSFCFPLVQCGRELVDSGTHWRCFCCRRRRRRRRTWNLFNLNGELQTVNEHEQQPPLNHCCTVPDNSSLM